MRHRVTVALATAFIIMAAMALPAYAVGTPIPPAPVPPKLNPLQRQHFIEGARDLGIPDKVINMALKDQNIAYSIPVHIHEEILPPGTIVPKTLQKANVSLPSRLLFATQTTRCRNTAVIKDNMVNYLNIRLFSYWYSQYFCWNGKIVTAWRGGNEGADGSITTAGKVAGWDYDGTSAYSNFRYTLGGRYGGGVDTSRTGTFKWCPYHIGCAGSARPTIRIWLHYNGTADHRCNTIQGMACKIT